MATTKPVRPDEVQVEANFSRGIVRDTMRSLIPEGTVYDSVDFMLEQPGRAYKRGGWQNHSAVLPAPPSMVGTIHIPTRVVAISNGDLYDVTSESGPIAVASGTVGFSPGENPTNSYGMLVLCHPQGYERPKKAYVTGPLGTVTLAALGGSPPAAAHSAMYASRLVLARGSEVPVAPGGDPNQKNRMWFSAIGDPETWDIPTAYIEATYEITGLAAIQSNLLVFSPRFCERLIGGVPPGTEGEDMELQPVGAVGCLDARSIAVIDNQVIFASEEGVYLTNGVGFDNLMENEDRSGILSFWRSLFAEHEVRGICGGMLNRNYYFVSTHSTDGSDYDFVCYLPTKCWWRTKNTSANMFAPGATEQETTELYVAMRTHPYVTKFSPLLKSGRNDGNGVPVEPNLETRMFGSGPGLKAYGFGRLTYNLHSIGTNPTLEVSQAIGLNGNNFLPVHESPLPKTNPFAGSPRTDRARFRLFKDSQGLYLRFDQHGASDETELFLVEVEHRPYNVASDGE